VRTYASSLTLVLGVGLGLALLVWKVTTAPPVIHRVVTQWLWCPFRAQNVEAELQEDPWNGRRVGISRCTAFTPPTAIICDKDCLRLRLDPARDLEANAQRLAEGMLVQPPQSTAERDRVTEELLIELHVGEHLDGA
jgi:hypothetical protein